MVAHERDIQRDLLALEADLKRLEAEYNMFFAGQLPRPPWETRGRVEAMVKRLKNRPKNLIVGGNIGKNKATPNDEATRDYSICFEALFPHVDYFVVNVSSPNTPGLRELQEKAPLTALLTHLQNLNKQKPAPKPILLKIAPDLTNEQLDDIIAFLRHLR